MIVQQTVKALVSGVHNLLPDEIIPKDAASDSLGWFTRDGHAELSYGRQSIGGNGAAGKNYGEHTAYRVDGTVVRFRKVDSAIQYLNGSTWTDVITGLTTASDYVFSNYQSLAGAFVYIFGSDGIYKICTANPASYATLYDAAINFKGFGFIDAGRTILWGIANDPSGFRYSWIDNQRAVSGSTGVYTTVAGEAIGALGSITYTGTLAFKAGGATRTCFGVTFAGTVAAGAETFTDNYNGVLTSNRGGTGTINYMTGAYSVTFSAVTTGAVTSGYQWENSNLRGVTDFTYSATRLAGEGNVLRQDYGGTPIKVVIPYDGNYFSVKENVCYRVNFDSTDVAPVNEIFRTDIGVKTLRSAVGTGKGVMFINTANISKPKLQVITKNPLGDNFDAVDMFPHFAFENYTFTDALVDTWDEYIIIGCKEDSNENNRLLMCNLRNNTVDPQPYGIRTSTKVAGILYGGDPLSKTTYELFTGFDDNGIVVTNFWDSNGETYGSDVLKKVKRLRFKGRIDPNQRISVYIELDNGDLQLVGVILGSGDYVDYTSTFAIGTTFIGQSHIGGGDTTTVYAFFIELKIKTAKFRKRKIRFVAEEFGYCSIEQMTDFDIWTYQDKMPSQYRVKQNVSLEGETNQPNPDY